MKQIFCSFVGTSLSLIIAGCIAADWIEFKQRQVELRIQQTISDVANAPANALKGVFGAISDF